MLKAIEKINSLDIGMICPGHGPILRSSWKKYVDLTKQLAENYLISIQSEVPRVLIAFVTAYGYTKEMARAIKAGLNRTGEFEIEMIDLEHASLGELEEKLSQRDHLGEKSSIKKKANLVSSHG